jgi:excisionase family DNA binding protein
MGIVTIGGKAVLTVVEAAEVMSCGQSTVRRMERDGRLRSVHIGAGDMRITAQSIQSYIESQEETHATTKNHEDAPDRIANERGA